MEKLFFTFNDFLKSVGYVLVASSFGGHRYRQKSGRRLAVKPGEEAQ